MNFEFFILNSRHGRRGAASRFVIACAFASAVAVALGMHYINRNAPGRPPTPASAEARPSPTRLQPSPSPTPAVKNAGPLQVFFTRDGLQLAAVGIPSRRNGASGQERAREALEALLRGPEDKQLLPPVPVQTVLRGFYLREDERSGRTEAVIDLSADVAKHPLGGMNAELLCVRALAQTALENCPGADSVRILIDGADARTLWGRVDLSGPFGKTTWQ